MKNKIIQLLLLICCLPALTGCIREEEYANDPIGNFEQLWKIIDEQYCFLEAKGIDWDAVHEKYRKLVVPTMSNDDLFDLLSQMLYTPVSYTHLDVYKRQSFIRAANVHKNRILLSPGCHHSPKTAFR